jgi:uncharacterized protein YkwD
MADPDGLAETTVSSWMSSEGHRRNILTSDAYEQGIGVVIQDDEAFVTQNFCRR